jgi:hypothetical protein
MKKLALLFCILISHISCIVAQTQVTAVTQYNECLDLKAVVTLFSNSSSVEDFEKSLNNSNLHILLDAIILTGAKVVITSKGNGAGKMEIEFYTHDDLEKLISLLSK